MLRRFLALAAALIAGGSPPAAAGGLELEVAGARGVGRAGATMVSDDAAAALLQNPAGLARRERLRFQLGASVLDQDAEFRPANQQPIPTCSTGEERGPPDILDRGGALAAPQLGVQGGAGRFVLGAAYVETGDTRSNLFHPLNDQCENDVRRLFPHRYGGVEFRYRRRALLAGAATRIADWLGIGVALSVSDVLLRERRDIWAGFEGRDPLGAPSRDLDLRLSGQDSFVPGAALSALVAPPPLPLELALSVAWSDAARLEGDAALRDTRSLLPFPQPIPTGPPPRSSTRLASPLELRAGARYLGDRLLAEVVAELFLFPTGNERELWRVQGIAVRDESSVVGVVMDVPALASRKRHGAVRGALDLEVVSGFLWLTAGYAYQGAAARARFLSPATGSLASHTVAGGVEVVWSDVTLTVGYARSFSAERSVAAPDTAVRMVNPFLAGSDVAAAGTYSRGADMFGLHLEVGWPVP